MEASGKAGKVLEARLLEKGWKGSWKPQVQSCGGLLTRNICSCTDTLCKEGWGQGLEIGGVGEGPQRLFSGK